MRVEFQDDDLQKLYEDPDFRLKTFGPELTSAFRKRMQMLLAAEDVRDLYAMKSNRFEKLKGDREGQYSLRINDQWRLVIELVTDSTGTKAVVIEVVDYH